ncbi:GspE/PulE family protein [Verrucomicrobiales bacterium]|nr:GspE/PulE family protein [Verrucomicrobiales bacterium]MDA7613634.1 GspE/PulE family protein [Verrucomicrobiales bacterium]
MFTNEEAVLETITQAGLIAEDDVATARKKPGSVIDHLVDSNIVSSEAIGQALAEANGMVFVDLADLAVDPAIIAAVPDTVAIKYHCVPLGFDDDRLLIAIADPSDFDSLDAIPHVLASQMEVEFQCGSEEHIQRCLEEFYGAPSKIDNELSGSMELRGGVDEGTSADEDAPIIRLVTNMLAGAFKSRTSDIHIEPLEKSLRVRCRIDGALHVTEEHPLKLLAPIVSRLKIMSGSMSISEKRIPQDGRISVKLGDKAIDLRVSSVPTGHGESIVMRILDKSSLLLGLPQLGFFSDQQELMEGLLKLPDGIILVTGPTGSGKTTTLYACLNYINKPDRKIITVEDPVEYQLSGINQVQVKADIGMTFAGALRAMLRQAPNIIMLGEIRDEETATIAINASLTGHLVFSTLHTNDAPGAVARLADMGIKPFLTASSVRAIMAQRLVRTICGKCKVPGEIGDKEGRMLHIDANRLAESTVMRGDGCDVCKQTGYKGRQGIYEIFNIDDEVRTLITEELTTVQLRRRARELGMKTLREDGIRKMLAGITSAQEVIRVTMGDDE